MRPATRSMCALAVAAAMALAPRVYAQDGVTKAQTEEARGRFARGVELYRDGDYRGALIEFNRAYQTAPNFRIQYNIGQTCVELQDYACGLRAFEKYVADGKGEAPADRKAFAEGEVKRLQKLVGYIRVVVDQPGAEVLIDNVSVGRTPLAEPILVGAGRRTVSVVLPPNPPSVRAVDIAGGDRVDVKMELSEPKREPPPPPTTPPTTQPQPRPAPPPEPRSNAPIWIAGITTGALTAGTVVFGLLTLSANSTLKSDADQYPTSGQKMDDARTKVNTLALVTDVLGGAAILGAGITTYLIFSSGSSSRTGSAPPPVNVGFGPGSAMVSGHF